MRKLDIVVLFVLLFSLTLSAGDKQKGTLTLKDLQPAGTTSKDNKNQMYDFIFTTGGNDYTCRTNRDTKLKATDFVVGGELRFEIDGDNTKLKNSSGKEVKCKIVRVQKAQS